MIAVGIPNWDANDNGNNNTGKCKIYNWNGVSWVQVGQDIIGEADSDGFGWSVSLNDLGDRVAIGAPWNDGSATASGHVRIYNWNGVSWVQMGQDIDGEAYSDNSGFKISFNSNQSSKVDLS